MAPRSSATTLLAGATSRSTSACDGANACEASGVEDDGALVWTVCSEKAWFTGTFNDERNLIAGPWEALGDDSTWDPWMDITVTRQPS
jgi:hypothetical protein